MKGSASAASRLRAIFKSTRAADQFQELRYRFASIADWSPLKVDAYIHSPIVKQGVQHDLYLSNNLLSLYARCSDVELVRRVFDEMSTRDIVSFTGLISAYLRNGMLEEALCIFNRITLHGFLPNEYTFSEILSYCSAFGDLIMGRCVHGSIIKYGLVYNTILTSTLIKFYSKLHNVEEALKAFLSAKCSDVITWTMAVSILVESEHWNQAIRLYGDMLKSKITPNEFTFVKVLAASRFSFPRCGKLIHAHMTVLGIEQNLVVKTALVDMYSCCGEIEDVIKASKLTQERNIYLWTAIISGFSKRLMIKEAISAFKEMEENGISANNFSYLTILSSCSTVLLLHLGEQIHCRVIKNGLESDISLGNVLIEMYMKCSTNKEYGVRAFQCIESPDVISWTSLISGLSSKGFQEESLSMFQEMRAKGYEPNLYTSFAALKACSFSKCGRKTQKLHGFITKMDFLDKINISNALVEAYVGPGMVQEAMSLFEAMSHRDVITYTLLASKLNEIGYYDLALGLIVKMFHDNVKMDEVLLSCYISISKRLVATKTGELLHGFSVKTGLYGSMNVINSLVDFYGKIGLLNKAQNVFMDAKNPNVVTWNSLIGGFASNGMISSALSSFDEMKLRGCKPDSFTFFFLMVACFHGELVELGLQHFGMMKSYKIEQHYEHYEVLIDLLGKCGQLEKALETIEAMQFEPDSEMFKRMLKYCILHENLHLGEDMARRGLLLDPSDMSFNQLLSKLYKTCGFSDLGKIDTVLSISK